MIAPSQVDVHALLPPLFACLPTAFASPKPPPALHPLLSPILSQRVQLLSESADCSSWLPLLNWDNQEASQLSSVVEEGTFEPHPVSGEIEVGDPEPTKYRRLDEETLQALVNAPDVGLAIVYIWSTAEGGEAWRVAEVKPLHGSWSRNPTPWEASIAAAQDAFESKTHVTAPARGSSTTGKRAEEEGNDDDDYWALYDSTPGRTPARTPAKRSPAPATLRNASNAEDAYWGQYAAVQPAMDSEDPDERAANQEHLGESGLDGNALLKAALTAQAQGAAGEPEMPQNRSLYTPNGSLNTDEARAQRATPPQRSLYTPNGTSTTAARHSPTDATYEHVEHPRPQSAYSSSSSRGSSKLVEQLEEQAGRSSSSRNSNTAADFAIQQHISTSMKSLYRLSKGAGMSRKEFERIVRAELGVLSIMDGDGDEDDD